jgi:hypothetical protein
MRSSLSFTYSSTGDHLVFIGLFEMQVEPEEDRTFLSSARSAVRRRCGRGPGPLIALLHGGIVLKFIFGLAAPA